jgi:hypothetical protein
MQRTVLNCAAMRVADATEVSGRVTADEKGSQKSKKMNPPRSHNRISKVYALVAATAIGIALAVLANNARADSLYVGDAGDNTVKRFDAESGVYQGIFVS